MQRPPRGYLPLDLRAPSLPPAGHIVCYLIGERDALVVDPGSPYPAEQRRLQRLLYRLRGGGGSLQGIFLTHHHRDHVGGARALAERFSLPVLAHAETHARVELGAAPRVEIQDGQALRLDGGQRRLRALHTPGHAPGHLCLFEDGAQALVSGDMVLGQGTTLIDPVEGHMGDYLRGLRRLADLAPCVVLPAHGPPLPRGAAAIEALIAHRVAREQRVLAALPLVGAASASRSELGVARAAYTELSPLLIALALRSTRAHLLELQRRGLAASDEKGWYATRAFGYSPLP